MLLLILLVLISSAESGLIDCLNKECLDLLPCNKRCEAAGYCRRLIGNTNLVIPWTLKPIVKLMGRGCTTGRCSC